MSNLTKKSYFIFSLLVCFHIAISAVFILIANSHYLDHLHNGEGFWKFAIDATLYHKEALIQVEYLREKEWFNWFFSYPNHQNVKAISVSYWITGSSNQFSFAFVNSLIWVFSILLIFKSTKLLIPESKVTPFIAVLFFFQPSILISSTQLLRDPIFILGICSFIYAWAVFEARGSVWYWLLFTLIGFILAASMRQYLFYLFVIPIVIFSPFMIAKNKKILAPLLCLFLVLFSYNLTYENDRVKVDGESASAMQAREYRNIENSTSITQQIKKELNQIEIDNQIDDKQIYPQSNIIEELQELNQIEIDNQIDDKQIFPQSNILESISRRVGAIRYDFWLVNIGSGSSFDENVRIYGLIDIIKYLPRAVQVGFLSPFPFDWFEVGKETGRIGKLISGMEMLTWYLCLACFTYVLFYKPKIIQPLIPVFLFSIVLIILYAYVVPNQGAIYRMRQGYMIPFYIFGSYGVYLVINRFKQKNK